MNNFLFRLFLPLLLAAVVTGARATEELDGALLPIQQQWAEIRYQTPEKRQAEAYEALEQQVMELEKRWPGRAEPLVWHGIILSSYAGAVGGIQSLTKALPAVKKSRRLLEQAEGIDPEVLDGSVYISLGALFYQVPGWPIGFGDRKKARRYLEKAVSEYPDAIDSNYFYGDFLFERGDLVQARKVLRHALQAPARPGRALADQGRRKEIEALLARIEEKLSG